jgi:hypothetical protein
MKMQVTLMRSLSLTAAVTFLATGSAFADPLSGLGESQKGFLIVGAVVAVFWAIGAWLIYAGTKSRKLAQASELWPTAEGTVLSAEVSKQTYRDPQQHTTSHTYTPQVRYSYSVAGKSYEGKVIRFGDMAQGAASLAEAIVAKYPAGAAVAVRYDPQSPSRATLETASAGGGQIWAGIFLIALPVVIAVVVLLVAAFSGSPTPEAAGQLSQPQP